MIRTLSLVVLAAVVGIGMTVASAQEGLHLGRKNGGPSTVTVERYNPVTAIGGNITAGREAVEKSLGN
jgi:hypothetical protein